MAARTTVGRRVESKDDLSKAGDYCLTTIEVEGVERRHLWFLLPLHVEGTSIHSRAAVGSGLHGITEPPWTFRECADGSIEVRASIACGRGGPHGEYWHGYLDEGHVWREL